MNACVRMTMSKLSVPPEPTKYLDQPLMSNCLKKELEREMTYGNDSNKNAVALGP